MNKKEELTKRIYNMIESDYEKLKTEEIRDVLESLKTRFDKRDE